MADGLWVRPLTSAEEEYEIGQSKHQHMITCYRLGLNTKLPLTVDTVRTALSALYWKAPHLRLCIRELDGSLWFREQEEETLDFKILKKVKDVSSEVVKQITTSFASSTGPLWRVVIFTSPCKPYNTEIYKTYPHQYDMLISYHNAITDGYTTIRVTNILLKLINDLLMGKDIDPTEQIGEFDSGDETEKLIKDRRKLWDDSPNWKNSLESEISKHYKFQPLMSKYFHVPKSEKLNTTLHIYRSLSRFQTERITHFFEYHNITITSGFMALANLQLVKMMRKRGSRRRRYEIPSLVYVNFRLYWEKLSDGALGHHSGPLCVITETAANNRSTWIEYAQDIGTNLLDFIRNKRALDENIFVNILRGTEYNNMDEYFSNPPAHPHFFYTVANIGDLSSVLSGEGEHVQMTWLSRHSSSHRSNSTLSNKLQTFRGRFFAVVDYNALTITKADAQEYIDGIFTFMFDIIRNLLFMEANDECNR